MTYWSDITEDGVPFATFFAVLSNIDKPDNMNLRPRICIGLNELNDKKLTGKKNRDMA